MDNIRTTVKEVGTKFLETMLFESDETIESKFIEVLEQALPDNDIITKWNSNEQIMVVWVREGVHLRQFQFKVERSAATFGE